MRIAIGAIVRTLGGPATYATELVAALVARRTPGMEYVVLTDGPEAFAGVDAETIRVPLASAYQQIVWDHLRVPRVLRSLRAELYHGTKNAVPWVRACPAVVTVHDLAVYHHPATFAAPQRWHLKLHTPHALRVARAVITVSEHAAADLRRRFPRHRAKVRAVPNGVATRFRPPPREEVAAFRAAHGLTAARTIGYLGTVQPRKNVELLAAAYARVAAALPGTELVVAGRTRPGYRPAIGGAGVRTLGALAADDVPRFYGAVDVVVSPSLYEGFGLTLLEAMACGAPVVALARSAVPEVVGDAGVLVEAPTEDALASAILRVLRDGRLAADLRERGMARARQFSWARAAEATEAIYASAVAPRR